ncbi:hypothetical protein [Rouxiella sp. T17]|uniref:hypothetical protein n=1 Tax=Rouxiella sp. T17 TaxID=3085684 RepID=UPI002FCBBE6C
MQKALITRSGLQQVNSILKKLLIDRRENPPVSIRPSESNRRGSRINFAAPASKKMLPRAAVYLGGNAPHTVEASTEFLTKEENPFWRATTLFEGAFPFIRL